MSAEIPVILCFVLGYIVIILEHPLKLNKTVPAILTGVLCWAIYILFDGSYHHIVEVLSEEHLSKTAEILLFLIGAMTIVELVDIHKGFSIITNRITTTSVVKLLWIVAFIAFFLSAALDNLTATIIMISLLHKLIKNKIKRRYFVGIIVIAANAGGAWSPIGDVTTTMLWIGGQITAGNIIVTLFLPSLVCLLVPLTIASIRLAGKQRKCNLNVQAAMKEEKVRGSRTIFTVGILSLIFVPVFKTITHLPPYMGIMFGLGISWLVSECIRRGMSPTDKKIYSVENALSKIDISSVLFFLGILLSVGALESLGILQELAIWMNDTVGNKDIIVFMMGLFSAVIDNVPLVAASMGMYDLAIYPQDHQIWEFIAYCAGTGGSVLIIGSAAGVTAMGLEKIDFMWYVKNISLLAFSGYVSGVVVYLACQYMSF